MANQIAVPLRDAVAETLFIPLYMRSLETERSGGLLQDPLACDMVRRIDHDFGRYSGGAASMVGTAIRVRHFDDQVRRFVREHEDPVVVNVGAGLDTRFHRVDQGRGIFYELDLPEVIAFRERLLPPGERDRFLATSMFETAWIDELVARHPGASFALVAEGVFMYFEESLVRPLFEALAARLPAAELHFDVSSSWATRNTSRHDTVRFTRATFKWGLDDDLALQSWSPRLAHHGTWGYLDREKRRWGWRGFVWRRLPFLKNAFRMLRYDVTPVDPGGPDAPSGPKS
ncbi:MAG: class I SAM-dependent methyltransferase [Desulfovibrionaceae bacterium]|jgi:methyltransferase (TIGR00027 family)|nr:class I SAM-dependent methyltransferase [Desulfovibrionaceae bacterium]